MLLGSTVLSSPSPSSFVSRASATFSHPDFDRAASLYHDVGLVRLDRPAPIFTNRFVQVDDDRSSIAFCSSLTTPRLLSCTTQPVCLPRPDSSPQPGSPVWTVGFGNLEFGGGPSDELRRSVSLKLVDRGECDDAFAGTIGKKLPMGINADVLCARDERHYSDPCQARMLQEHAKWWTLP